MTFHAEVLGRSQAKVLRQLGPLMTSRRFYLAGGTAIALILGHRRSVDLDWFTPGPIADGLVLAAELAKTGLDLRTRSASRGTLHASIAKVRITFLEYRYPLIRDPLIWSEAGCSVASLDDLACMKLSAIAQRGAKKDFVDLYALGIKHGSLEQMLRMYQRKYSVRDIAHVLYGLGYFDDAEKEPMPEMIWDLDWRAVKRSIRSWLVEAARRK